jgi:hypothetical protein
MSHASTHIAGLEHRIRVCRSAWRGGTREDNESFCNELGTSAQIMSGGRLYVEHEARWYFRPGFRVKVLPGIKRIQRGVADAGELAKLLV